MYFRGCIETNYKRIAWSKLTEGAVAMETNPRVVDAA